MDLRQIRYFVAACETGSLSGAAERLNCTAPGVSQQMSALEARLGTRLFERTSRGVRPTAAGSRFYDRCLAVLKAVSEAEIELQDFKAGLSGSVSAGFAPGIARSILPQALARFTREFPRIDIDIASGTADLLLSETSAGGLDFYVGQFARKQLGLAATHIGRFPVSLISGVRRGLTSMRPVRLDNLAPLKLFVPSGVPGALLPLVVSIEVISFLSRPISLSIRLFANMLAGHITLKVFAGFVTSLGALGAVGVAGSILPLLMTVALTGLEFLVSFLQAYVFAVLTCMYLNDAVHPGGH